jgi:hypothetical protein
MSNFWTDELTSEPKRNYRFRVTIGGAEKNSEATSAVIWWAKKCTKPAFTVGETTHKLLNHTFHFPSTVTWETVTITMVDPIAPSSTNIMLDLLTKAGYALPSAAVGLDKTVSKNLMGAALGNVNIIHMDADGNDLETWLLHNAFIKSVKFSDLDYDSEDLSTCDLELRYDWATMESKTGGTGGTTEAPAGPASVAKTWTWTATTPGGGPDPDGE